MDKGLEGTFSLNKTEAIHRWFEYMEGYSNKLVETELNKIGIKNVSSLYDPFGGSGTSLISASANNITPYYSETNPVMSFICSTKINSVIAAKNNKTIVETINNHKDKISSNFTCLKELPDYQGFEKFYTEKSLSTLLSIKQEIEKIEDLDAKALCKVALASIDVKASKMIRRGDLRYARDKELQQKEKDILSLYLNKIQQIIDDIENTDVQLYQKVTKLADDSRNIDANNLFDCVITSPPYLNGKNYIRNTKLELKLLDFIKTEKELPQLHSKGIIAGINSVSNRSKIEILDCVKAILEILTPITYDKRIPLMVAGYFYDMNTVLYKLSKGLKNHGKFIMDIGDSQFSGIHIPTHELLEELALQHGFKKYDEEILRKRFSNNGMELTQRVLRFELIKE